MGNRYSTLYPSMKDVYLKLLSAGLRALVYNGDTDMACNFLGDQWFVEDLGIEVWPLLFRFSFPFLMNRIDFTFKCMANVCFQASTQYQAWMYDHQIGGFYQQFGNLTFLTVKVTPFMFYFPPYSLFTWFHYSYVLFQGAGHMVPQWAPGPAFHLFQSFLNNASY